MNSGFKFGIGADIESITRFKRLDRKKDAVFLGKIFSKRELDYCFSKQKPYLHLAARFSGKEAVIKAINSLRKKAPSLNKIEILNNPSGLPQVSLKDKITKNLEIHLSLQFMRIYAF